MCHVNPLPRRGFTCKEKNLLIEEQVPSIKLTILRHVLTVFQSYQDDKTVIMKGCVKWNPVYGCKEFLLKSDSNTVQQTSTSFHKGLTNTNEKGGKKRKWQSAFLAHLNKVQEELLHYPQHRHWWRRRRR